jgi:hypothetical protein
VMSQSKPRVTSISRTDCGVGGCRLGLTRVIDRAQCCGKLPHPDGIYDR